MEREQVIDRQIAVLVDAENVGLNSIQWLFDQISDIGRIIIKRAYADWTVTGNTRDQLLELGIEPIQLFRSSSRGKNSSDIRLAVDAVDLLHSSPVDTFVIVSSDSDFVPLVSKLRAAGKIVFGAGEQGKVPRTLVQSCDRYIYLNQTKGTKEAEQVSLLPDDDIENYIGDFQRRNYIPHAQCLQMHKLASMVTIRNHINLTEVCNCKDINDAYPSFFVCGLTDLTQVLRGFL